MDFDHLLADAKKEESRPRSEILTVIKATEFFKNLGAEELDAVSKCIIEKTFRAGEILIAEGTPGEYFFLVKRGKVAVEKMTAAGPVMLARLSSGQCFGEMSLIENYPTSATVSALEDSEILMIGRLDLNVLLNWNTVLAAKMWKAFTEMLSQRIRVMNEKLLDAIQDGKGAASAKQSCEIIERAIGIEKAGA
jgi:CRP-like cAMP-binding protein